MSAVLSEFKWLQLYAPCFKTHSSNIQVLREPSDFHYALKILFSNAKKRICLSSLYLGTGHLEQQLVDCVEDSLKKNSGLDVKILLDHSRGLRGDKNSKTMLQHLKDNVAERFQLYLYHTPNLRGVLKRLPNRYNETIGVFHMKIYIADDTLVMSG
jgi:CDP-diacylglycerol---glycerol-3-phosphate 3-phosphatidyltransferase